MAQAWQKFGLETDEEIKYKGFLIADGVMFWWGVRVWGLHSHWICFRVSNLHMTRDDIETVATLANESWFLASKSGNWTSMREFPSKAGKLEFVYRRTTCRGQIKPQRRSKGQMDWQVCSSQSWRMWHKWHACDRDGMPIRWALKTILFSHMTY